MVKNIIIIFLLGALIAMTLIALRAPTAPVCKQAIDYQDGSISCVEESTQIIN